MLWRVRTVYAKCRNRDCPHESFALPVPGVQRYQRATTLLIQEGVVGLVADNTTLARMARRFARSFNTTGSKSALGRCKHQVARQYDFPAIQQRLGFSGALCLDESWLVSVAKRCKTARAFTYVERSSNAIVSDASKKACRKAPRWSRDHRIGHRLRTRRVQGGVPARAVTVSVGLCR